MADSARFLGSFELQTSSGPFSALMFERDGRRSVTFPPSRRSGAPRAAIEASEVSAEFARSALAAGEKALGITRLPTPDGVR